MRRPNALRVKGSKGQENGVKYKKREKLIEVSHLNARGLWVTGLLVKMLDPLFLNTFQAGGPEKA